MIKFVSVEPAEPINLKQKMQQDYERYRATLTDPKIDLHEAEEQEKETEEPETKQ